MIIRQTCLFSFEDIIKFQSKTKLELIFDALDIHSITEIIPNQLKIRRGPKGYDHENLFLSVIAMQIEKLHYVKDLVLRLKQDPIFRYTCGFDVLGETPSEATFSRFITALSKCDTAQKLFQNLVLKGKEMGLIEGENISIDSTKIDSYEAPKPKAKITDDQSPNWGMKRDTHGNNIRWFGWKTHILCDSESELPLEIMVTPASPYDSTIAIPLIKQFREHFQDTFKPKYFTMDSGYDVDAIYTEIIENQNALPIIALNPRGAFAPPEGFNEAYHPVWSGGYPLIYWGKDADYLKFRCPHVLGKCNCPHGSSWCSHSDYGYTLKVNIKENPRICTYPTRSSEQWKTLYNTRTAVERCNSRLKVYLNLDNVRSKGIEKCKLHVLLNCIALLGGTIGINSRSSASNVAKSSFVIIEKYLILISRKWVFSEAYLVYIFLH